MRVEKIQEMEFVSEDEKREFQEIHGKDSIYIKNNEFSEILNNEIDKLSYYYVSAFVSGSPMYVSNRGVTYQKNQARKFSKSDAERKVFFMNKSGTYLWKTVKC